MILYVARAEKRRPELAKRLRARRKLIADIVETTSKSSGGPGAVNPAWTGAILLALEDGFRLHRLIDPETTPADSFLRAVGDLQRAIGHHRTPDAHRLLRSRRPQLAGDRAHLAGRGPPDRERRQQAHGDADRERDRVGAGHIVQQAGDPRPGRAARQRGEHDGAEDAAVIARPGKSPAPPRP